VPIDHSSVGMVTAADRLEALAGVVAVGTLPVGILTAVFVGGIEALVVFVVGWLLVTPVLGIVAETVAGGDAGESAHGETARDPLETLRDRYASGEIGEAEFERRVERLLETEDGPEGGPPGPRSTGEERRDAGTSDDDRDFETEGR